MFSRVCDPEGAAYVQSQCPRVAAWVERCSKDPVVLKTRCGCSFDPRAPANCGAARHMVRKYFKHQADLLPAYVDEVLAPYDAFAAGSAPLLAFEDVDVHLFAGGLRLGDKLVESCIFSDNVYAACVQAGWKLRRHWIDLEDKPQWFLDLVAKNEAKAETPCALIKKADGSAEFVIDTTKLLERLAPSKGEGFPVADADVMPGLMMPWFSYQASLPVLVRDVRDAAKASAKEEKLTAFIERLKLLDAYLQDHDYLSGGSAPGWSDWRFIFLAGITVMMTKCFDPPGASKLEEQCPKVIAWINRMTRDPIFLRTREGVAYDPVAPQNALSMRHLVHKYFKHQKDLVPAFVDDVLAPFDAAAATAKQKAAAPATTGDAIAQSGLAKKELATFCL
jgi:hypothetical protein